MYCVAVKASRAERDVDALRRLLESPRAQVGLRRLVWSVCRAPALPPRRLKTKELLVDVNIRSVHNGMLGECTAQGDGFVVVKHGRRVPAASRRVTLRLRVNRDASGDEAHV